MLKRNNFYHFLEKTAEKYSIYWLISICHKGDIVVSQDYGDPKKRTSEDDEHFSESFEKMIRMAIQNREGENNGKPVISPIVNG